MTCVMFYDLETDLRSKLKVEIELIEPEYSPFDLSYVTLSTRVLV